MKKVIKTMEEYISEIEENVSMKNEMVKMLEETLEHFSDGNIKLKNNAKQIKENNISISVNEDDDLKSLRNDFQDFKKCVWNELSIIKHGVLQENVLPHDEKQKADVSKNEGGTVIVKILTLWCK